MKHLKSFETENNQYVIITDGYTADSKQVYVYRNENTYSNFEYINKFETENRTLVLFTLEEAINKKIELNNMYTTFKFEYITTKQLKQLIEDIEIKININKYNL